jgi:YHS domain-containing protein
MTLNRRSLLSFLAATVSAAVFAPAYALDPASTAPVNLDKAGVALRGHDPVGYFTAAKPVPGTSAFQSKWEGATYQFATAANKTAFDAEPAKYAPKYGGFCAYAASQGYKADADPNAWKIVDGKLYVNYNKAVGLAWQARQTAFIEAGDKNWPKVQNQLPK